MCLIPPSGNINRRKFHPWLSTSASGPGYKLPLDNSLGEKETNFKWFGNHLKSVSVKVNQAEGLEKSLCCYCFVQMSRTLLPQNSDRPAASCPSSPS